MEDIQEGQQIDELHDLNTSEKIKLSYRGPKQKTVDITLKS